MADVILALIAYFVGTLPSAYLCGRFFKRIDIRQTGSGNVGAMNTLRNVGFLPGVLTLAADIAKGSLAVYLACRYGSWPLLPLCASFLVILGHNYNIFLGLKGGKGLGSLVGCLLLLAPAAILYLFVCMVAVALATRDTNTASGLGVLSLPLVLGLQKGHWVFFIGGAAISLLIMARHCQDFRAYRQGRRKMV